MTRNNFQKLVTRKHALLTDNILITAWNDRTRFENLTGYPDVVQNLEIVDGDFYFDSSWLEAVTQNHKNDPLEKFWFFIEQGYKHGEALVAFAKNLKVTNDRQKLENDFRQSVELMKNLLVFLPITHPLAEAIKIRMTEILKSKGIKENDLNQALLEISKPEKMNSPLLEIEDLKSIKQKSKTNPSFDVDEALRRHAAQYSFLGYREPFSKGFDLDFFK
jgi:hypothetical protein